MVEDKFNEKVKGGESCGWRGWREEGPGGPSGPACHRPPLWVRWEAAEVVSREGMGSGHLRREAVYLVHSHGC